MDKEKGELIESGKYNEGTKQRQLLHEIVSSAQNYQTLYKAYREGRAKDIVDWEHPPMIEGEKTPCIIIGSGPSLDNSIEFLRAWSGGIFCTTSHALTLIRNGIIPTHIVALDPFCTYDEIAGVDWSKTETKLVACPNVWPTLIQQWPNDIVLYLEETSEKNSFYQTIQKYMYTVREDQGKGIRDPVFRFMVRSSFALFACSPPMQLFAADKLGYGTAFLCGCDFSYPYGKERFTEWKIKDLGRVEQEGRKYIDEPYQYNTALDPLGFYNDPNWDSYWIKEEHPLKDIPKERGPMLTANGIPSERVHVYYKKNFLTSWRLCNKTVYTTDQGAITEIPYRNIRTVIDKKGLGFIQQKKWWIRKVTDEYLASVGCYVIESKEGLSFIETAHPNDDLYEFMKNLYQQYSCSECKRTLLIEDYPPYYRAMKDLLSKLEGMDPQSKDPELINDLSNRIKSIEANTILKDHEFETCPACGKGKLSHLVHIDIPLNMERFNRVINKISREDEDEKQREEK